jgi:hypothetical protein
MAQVGWTGIRILSGESINPASQKVESFFSRRKVKNRLLDTSIHPEQCDTNSTGRATDSLIMPVTARLGVLTAETHYLFGINS